MAIQMIFIWNLLKLTRNTAFCEKAVPKTLQVKESAFFGAAFF
jgi:hypothetical protein